MRVNENRPVSVTSEACVLGDPVFFPFITLPIIKLKGSRAPDVRKAKMDPMAYSKC